MVSGPPRFSQWGLDSLVGSQSILKRLCCSCGVQRRSGFHVGVSWVSSRPSCIWQGGSERFRSVRVFRRLGTVWAGSGVSLCGYIFLARWYGKLVLNSGASKGSFRSSHISLRWHARRHRFVQIHMDRQGPVQAGVRGVLVVDYYSFG